jgi:hypothetical protein
MAGPSIAVRVLADLSALGKSMTGVTAQGTAAASRMKSAFSGMLGTLNASGVMGPFGNALMTAQTSLEHLEKSTKSTGTTMMGLGGTALGVGMVLQQVGSKDQAAHQQLQAAVQATGHSYDQYAGKVEAAIGHQEHFGHTADQTQNALQVLTQATGSPTKALGLLNTATDLAAAKHMDLVGAATQLGKAYNGSGRILKEYGITTTVTGSAQKVLTTDTKLAQAADAKAATAKQALTLLQTKDGLSKTHTALTAMQLKIAQDKVSAANLVALTSHQKLAKAQDDVKNKTSSQSVALGELSKKLSGQAAASADTFSGKLDAMKAKITDSISQFGQKYGPAIAGAGAAMTGLGATLEITKAATTALKDAQIIQTAITWLAEAATWAWNAALDANPITLIAILIAVVLVGAVLLIITHLHDFEQIILDVWHYAVVAFDGVKGAVMDVVNWISQHWPLLLAILTGPIGLAIYFITSNFDTLVGFVTGLPGRIAHAAAGIWDWVAKPFIHLLNDVIHAWNDLHFTTPSVDIFGYHTPSVTIGVPHIPDIPGAAQGGLMTKTGLIYAHAGELISPAPNISNGPVVSIDNAHFHNELDIDAIMRRAAWLGRSRAVRLSA